MATKYNIQYPDKFRENIRKEIGKLIDSTDSTLNSNIEISIYNYAIDESTKRNIVKKWTNPSFVTLYIDRLRSIYMNLKSNPDLVEQIKTKEIDPTQVGFLTHYEMNPKKWKDVIEMKKKRDASLLNTNVEASTDMYLSLIHI